MLASLSWPLTKYITGTFRSNQQTAWSSIKNINFFILNETKLIFPEAETVSVYKFRGQRLSFLCLVGQEDVLRFNWAVKDGTTRKIVKFQQGLYEQRNS